MHQGLCVMFNLIYRCLWIKGFIQHVVDGENIELHMLAGRHTTRYLYAIYLYYCSKPWIHFIPPHYMYSRINWQFHLVQENDFLSRSRFMYFFGNVKWFYTKLCVSEHFEYFQEHTYLGHKKALWKEHDFTNLLKIWYNNHHRPEKSLNWFWQLCATSISRIHCNKDPHSRIHGNFLTFKLKSNQ